MYKESRHQQDPWAEPLDRGQVAKPSEPFYESDKICHTYCISVSGWQRCICVKRALHEDSLYISPQQDHETEEPKYFSFRDHVKLKSIAPILVVVVWW